MNQYNTDLKYLAYREKIKTKLAAKGYKGQAEIYPTTLIYLYKDRMKIKYSVNFLIQLINSR